MPIILQLCNEEKYPLGKIFFHEGDECKYIYFIIDGEVEITYKILNSEDKKLKK